MRRRWLLGLGGALMGAPLLHAQAPGGATRGAAPAASMVVPGLPRSELAVSNGRDRVTPFWRSEAPGATEAGTLWATARPDTVAPGVTVEERLLRGSGEGWRTQLVVVTLDPSRVALALDSAFVRGRRAWTIDRAPPDAVVAVNAGQFVADLPWGWVVLDGRTFLPPGRGPLASTVAVDSAGRVRWTHGGTPNSSGVRWAFQSYPTLVQGGVVSDALTRSDGGVDVTHRDARLALGTRADGTVVLAMTRFGGLGGALGFLPFGLTTPEMAGVMRALGATDAVLLDGGISAQLLVRGRSGGVRRWSGTRAVPLALVGRVRR